jgi:cell division transport system permease protein
MRLVGATDAYIRRPFLVEGFAKGILGGIFALAMTWLAQALINKYVIHTIFFDARIAFLGLLFGALIGLAGSAVSIGRHLRRV